MTSKAYLMALMLAGFPAVGMAQAGSGCQGLVGGAMAQCVQGLGLGTGPGLYGGETPRQDARKSTGAESPRSAADGGAAIANSNSAKSGSSTSSVWNFLGGLSFGLGGSGDGKRASIGTPLNCQGLVGGAMAQCVQGMGSASSSVAGAAPRQDGPIAANSESAGGTDSNAGGSDWDFELTNHNLKCQGLVGGAMAQCLRDM